MCLPACSGRRVWCREGDSAAQWWVDSVESSPLPTGNNRGNYCHFPIDSQIKVLSHLINGCWTHHSFWSISEDCNFGIENYMSKHQRLIPWVRAFLEQKRLPLTAYICPRRFRTQIRSPFSVIYSTLCTPKAFVLAPNAQVKAWERVHRATIKQCFITFILFALRRALVYWWCLLKWRVRIGKMLNVLLNCSRQGLPNSNHKFSACRSALGLKVV